jgi:transposase
MSRTALPISVSPRAAQILQKAVRQRTLEKHYTERMDIILLSNLGKRNMDIASQLGIVVDTVMKWQKRWRDNEEGLLKLESGYGGKQVTENGLLKEYKRVLSDLQRSGSPGHLTEVDIALLQALACESPEKYGLSVTTWTHELLSKQAKEKGITISPAHYGRILKKTN